MITESSDSSIISSEAPLESQLDDLSATIFDNDHRYGFQVGEVGFLYPPSLLGEIVKKPSICQIPHTYHWLLGVVNLRGALIPVVDLQGCLYNVDLISPSIILILDKGKKAMAFALESSPVLVTHLDSIERAEVEIPEAISEAVTNIYRDSQEQIWLEFNHEIFFSKLGRLAKTC